MRNGIDEIQFVSAWGEEKREKKSYPLEERRVEMG